MKTTMGTKRDSAGTNAATGVRLHGTNGESWCPIDVSLAKDKQHYITGMLALNLVDEQTGGAANWHETAALWTPSTRAGEQGDHANRELTVPMRTHGTEGIEDGRKALRHGLHRHPAHASAVPIWCATHTRAIVDLAFDRSHRGHRALHAGGKFGPVVPCTIADWLWIPEQIEELKRYCARARARAEAEISPADREWWRRWWQSIRFDISHEDYIRE